MAGAFRSRAVTDALLAVREDSLRSNPGPVWQCADRFRTEWGPGTLLIPFDAPEGLVIDHHLTVSYRPDSLLAEDEWAVPYDAAAQCVVRLTVRGPCPRERLLVLPRAAAAPGYGWVPELCAALAQRPTEGPDGDGTVADKGDAEAGHDRHPLPPVLEEGGQAAGSPAGVAPAAAAPPPGADALQRALALPALREFQELGGPELAALCSAEELRELCRLAGECTDGPGSGESAEEPPQKRPHTTSHTSPNQGPRQPVGQECLTATVEAPLAVWEARCREAALDPHLAAALFRLAMPEGAATGNVWAAEFLHRTGRSPLCAALAESLERRGWAALWRPLLQQAHPDILGSPQLVGQYLQPFLLALGPSQGVLLPAAERAWLLSPVLCAPMLATLRPPSQPGPDPAPAAPAGPILAVWDEWDVPYTVPHLDVGQPHCGSPGDRTALQRWLRNWLQTSPPDRSGAVLLATARTVPAGWAYLVAAAPGGVGPTPPPATVELPLPPRGAPEPGLAPPAAAGLEEWTAGRITHSSVPCAVQDVKMLAWFQQRWADFPPEQQRSIAAIAFGGDARAAEAAIDACVAAFEAQFEAENAADSPPERAVEGWAMLQHPAEGPLRVFPSAGEVALNPDRSLVACVTPDGSGWRVTVHNASTGEVVGSCHCPRPVTSLQFVSTAELVFLQQRRITMWAIDSVAAHNTGRRADAISCAGELLAYSTPSELGLRDGAFATLKVDNDGVLAVSVAGDLAARVAGGLAVFFAGRRRPLFLRRGTCLRFVPAVSLPGAPAFVHGTEDGLLHRHGPAGRSVPAHDGAVVALDVVVPSSSLLVAYAVSAGVDRAVCVTDLLYGHRVLRFALTQPIRSVGATVAGVLVATDDGTASLWPSRPLACAVGGGGERNSLCVAFAAPIAPSPPGDADEAVPCGDRAAASRPPACIDGLRLALVKWLRGKGLPALPDPADLLGHEVSCVAGGRRVRGIVVSDDATGCVVLQQQLSIVLDGCLLILVKGVPPEPSTRPILWSTAVGPVGWSLLRLRLALHRPGQQEAWAVAAVPLPAIAARLAGAAL